LEYWSDIGVTEPTPVTPLLQHSITPIKSVAFLKTEAVVIKTTNLREADKIVTFFSKDSGKIQGIAKSVRKIRARYGGKLDLFTRVNVIFFQKLEPMQGRGFPERHPLLPITQVDVLESFSRLKLEFPRIVGASYIAEFLNRVFEEYDATHPKVYDLVCETFRTLSSSDQIRNILPAFEIKLLAHLGYAPTLDRCVGCQTHLQASEKSAPPKTGQWGFSSSAGGVVCPRCRPLKKDAIPITLQAIEQVRQLLKHHIRRSPEIALSAQQYHEIKGLLANHFRYHVGISLNTEAFVQKLRAANLIE
jgi:DNA repair protein RecO (recombination protein O)